MTPSPQGAEPWMPNGFPPPSFVVETERTRTFAGARGRWLAAAAILGALLLIAGILLIARDDDKTDVATGTTTTVFGGTNPTFPDSSVLDPTATIPDAGTVPGGAIDPNATTIPGGGGTGTTVPGGPTPPGPGPGPGAGVLAVSPGAVGLGRVEGVASGKVTLSNTGGSPLTFTSASESPGALTASPGSGTIAPGAAADVTITLDGNKVAEGGFARNVGFSANGAIQRVNVTATAIHPPNITDAGAACAVENATCSKQIQLVAPVPPGATPCTHPWRYRVNVADESLLKSVKAEASLAQYNATLKSADGTGPPTNAGQGFWASDPFQPVPAGTTFKFTILAVDQYDASRRSSPERTITCP